MTKTEAQQKLFHNNEVLEAIKLELEAGPISNERKMVLESRLKTILENLKVMAAEHNIQLSNDI